MVMTYQDRYVKPMPSKPEEYGEYAARLLRYELYWSFYESTQHNATLHTAWADVFKGQMEAYTYIRPLFGVGYRLGEFWGTHLLGGPIDHDAGNGVTVPSALPILGASDGLRAAIARLWFDSRWSVEKDVLARQGSVMGDAFIEVVPDFEDKLPWMRVVNPATVREIEKDRRDRIVGCTIAEQRPDPREDGKYKNRKVTYTRTMTKNDSGGVDVYTYLDGQEYAWGEGPSKRMSRWTLEIDFVPLIHIEHKDIGFGWGESELAGPVMTIVEADGLGSNLSDWQYRALNGPKFLTGVQAKDIEIKAKTRETISIYSTTSKDAKIATMLDPLDIGAAAGTVGMLLDAIERQCPELRVDNARSSGDMSGKSMREARKPAETRVESRRTGYDEAIVRAHQIAIALGSAYGWEGYRDFPKDPEADELDHRIGDRDVFAMDMFDRLEEQTGRFTMIQAARAAGLSLSDALSRAGISQEEIDAALAEQKRAQMLQLLTSPAARQSGPEGGMDPALAGALAQFVNPPGPNQTPTRLTQDRQAMA